MFYSICELDEVHNWTLLIFTDTVEVEVEVEEIC